MYSVIEELRHLREGLGNWPVKARIEAMHVYLHNAQLQLEQRSRLFSVCAPNFAVGKLADQAQQPRNGISGTKYSHCLQRTRSFGWSWHAPSALVRCCHLMSPLSKDETTRESQRQLQTRLALLADIDVN